jgi:hypothetical protein
MEEERLKLSIGRFDHYYDSINNKCTVMLTLNTFIVGGLIASYPILLEKIECGLCFHGLMTALLGLGLAIMITVTSASIPFLGGRSNSLLFWGDIAGITETAFNTQSQAQSATDALNDLRSQAYHLACGLRSKFRLLRIVGQMMIIQFILFVPLFLVIICNIKK